MSEPGLVHVGIGGWDFEGWKDSFYPAGLRRADRLAHAATRLTAIEIEATNYRLQKRELFERWGAMAPPGFRFAVKASRYCTNRKDLGDAAEPIGRFVGQGLTAFGPRLGPILWQLAPTKKFDPDELRRFLALLPARVDGVALRHAIEPRHESFRCPEFVTMVRGAGVAIVLADHDAYPCLADATADFAYVRLQRTREDEPAGYSAPALDHWAAVLAALAAGGRPLDLPHVFEGSAAVSPREVFAFVIGGAKARNPAAAEALIARLGEEAK